MSDVMPAVIGGILPFGAIFVELFFVLSSLWDGRYYYVFGFLLLSFLILIHTCAQVTIVLTYFQLCNEDYRWYVTALIAHLFLSYSLCQVVAVLPNSGRQWMLCVSVLLLLLLDASGRYEFHWSDAVLWLHGHYLQWDMSFNGMCRILCDAFLCAKDVCLD